MKKIILSAVSYLAFAVISAQAPIPTSWDITDVNPPTGWSTGGGAFAITPYTTIGSPTAPALRMNSEGQFVQVNFAAEAGIFSCEVRGQVAPDSTVFWGTIKLQESVNGTTWTDMLVRSNQQIPSNNSGGNFITLSDTLASASRYARVLFFDKYTGINFALDNLQVGAPLPKPQAEIDVMESNISLFDQGNLYIGQTAGNTKRINIVVENLGTDSNLNLSSVTLSNTTGYSIVSSPLSIPALAMDTIKLDYTPTASGTTTSDLTIINNDSDEGSFTIKIVGYGNNTASEPINQPTSFAVNNNKSFRHYISYTSSNDAEGYIILRKKGSSITAIPTDGQTYNIGDMIGDAKVGYIGSKTNYRANQVFANETHHYAIFSYNGFGQYINYKTTTPLTGIVNTPGNNIPNNYYQNIQTTSASFVTDLHNRVNPHTTLFYGDFDDTYINEFAAIDTTGGQKAVLGHYTGDYYLYTEPFGFTTISREHSFPHSWMPSYSSESVPEYSDYHNLYPVFQNEANAVRSNNPLGEVVTVTSSHIDGKYGVDANGNNVYEPRDEQKGNSARAIFYMSIAYTGVNGNTWNLPNPIDPIFVPYGQDQDVLKAWHWQDPVDGFDIARNDYIDSIQGNRNPFVDSMNYVCFINFDNMTKVTTSAPCTSTPDNSSVKENTIFKGIHYYPVPTTDELTIEINLTSSIMASIKVYDLTGKEVMNSNTEKFNIGKNKTKINIADLASGIYNITIFTPEESTSFKINKH